MGKSKMRTSARVQHKVAKGEWCLMGQILLLLGGPRLLLLVKRWR